MSKFSILKIILIFFLLPTLSIAQGPDTVSGKLIFLGVSNDSTKSVWLSVTTAGSFRLEAQGNQVIDVWGMSRRGLHLSLSPIVSQGNGGTHFLINAVNNRKLDSQNQKGGIVFPPLPSEPPTVMPPIVVYPEHPIVLPPESPSVTPPENPIVNPPGSGYSKPTNITADTRNGKSSSQRAPVTKGRQFDLEKEWNVWSDNYYFNSNDARTDLNTKGVTTNFTIGADRRIANNLVLGSLLSFIKYNYNAFSGDLKNQASGFTLGPYFGYSICPSWAVDGRLTYGQLQNNNGIATLTSQFRTQVFHADFHSTVLYLLNENFQLRTKPLISFTHFRNPAYLFNGVFADISFQIKRPEESFNFGFAELRIEGNYTVETKNGTIIQTYAEPGIDYAFVRPNDGQILTSNLNLASTSPVVETLTIGVRTLLSRVFLLDVSGSYLSFGQKGLDVWELRLLASYSFG